jgi:predicted nucleic acid-binding protein
VTVAPVFVDTAALIALSLRGDRWHAQAKRVQQELVSTRTPLITSDWVLLEYLNAASRPEMREAASRVVRRIEASHHYEIVPGTRELWTRSFELFESRPDKAWSLVDCGSILLCQERSIERVWTSDHHLTQAGLQILLR